MQNAHEGRGRTQGQAAPAQGAGVGIGVMQAAFVEQRELPRFEDKVDFFRDIETGALVRLERGLFHPLFSSDLSPGRGGTPIIGDRSFRHHHRW